MKRLNNTLRAWLFENDYKDVAKIIDDILIEWREKGNKQRRNWWDILAGDVNGKPRVISGREIPVLKAAQIRKNVLVTENALCRNENESNPLPIKEQTRWKSK